MKKRNLEKSLVGITGVYYAAAELSRMGYIALITARNTRAYDILIFKEGKYKTLPIQVKTSSGDNFHIVLIKDIKKMSRDLNKKITCPYILVKLKYKNPEFYILNAKQMKNLVKKDWNIWLNKKHHKPVRTKNVRIIFQQKEILKILENKFKDKWKENLILD